MNWVADFQIAIVAMNFYIFFNFVSNTKVLPSKCLVCKKSVHKLLLKFTFHDNPRTSSTSTLIFLSALFHSSSKWTMCFDFLRSAAGQNSAGPGVITRVGLQCYQIYSFLVNILLISAKFWNPSFKNFCSKSPFLITLKSYFHRGEARSLRG